MNDLARKIRILQVGKYYPPEVGGIESHLKSLSEHLSKSIDVQVLVALAGQGTGSISSAPKVSRAWSLLTVAGAPICPGMVPRIAFSRADIVHVHLPNPGAVLACLASGFRGCLVATWHSDVVRQKKLARLFAPFLRLFLSSCNAIIIATKEYLESSQQLATWVDRCRVIPYGISVADFDIVDHAAVERIKRSASSPMVLAAGRLVYYKGIDYLLRAMREVDATLVIAGDGPDYRRLEQLAWEMGIRWRVVFAGKVDDLRPYYHAADVFVLPSIARSESFGIVQLEAMACRTPVVNTRIPTGVPRVSVNGITGFTVAPADSEALTSALRRLLTDTDLRLTFGEAARKRVETTYSADAMANRVTELYSDLLSRKTGLRALSPRPV